MSDVRAVVAEFASIAASSLPIWRDAAIVGLGLLVIGCLWIAASLLGDGS